MKNDKSYMHIFKRVISPSISLQMLKHGSLSLVALYSLGCKTIKARDDRKQETMSATSQPSKGNDQQTTGGGAPSGKAGEQSSRKRIFILAGQSNMVGLQHEASFRPYIQAAYPTDEIVILKSACNSQTIRRWDQDWKFPASIDPVKAKSQDDIARKSATDCPIPADNKYGDLMRDLSVKLKSTVGSDTPKSVAFVWMQGETDASMHWHESYEESLRRVIGKIREEFPNNKVALVLGRLSDHRLDSPKYPGWNVIRNIQVRVAEEMSRNPGLAAWQNTDDLNGSDNNIHYTPEGYRRFGEAVAKKVILLTKEQETK